MRRLLWLLVLAAFYAACIALVQPDLPRLWAGLPRLLRWLAGAFPPDFSGLPDLLRRAAETVAIATLGTSLAALLALPLTLLAARPVAPLPALYHPARGLLDALRGIDGFVFALIFVAAVGLGPFAGMLGIALHSAGSIAKLWSEALETADFAPVEAALSAGGSRAQAAAVVLLPETLPQTASALLYVWEFNIRASTVLGLVGAGGLGQELKNAVDLLDFARVLAILIIIVALVLAADRLSVLLRRRLA
ncbi:phosphonate ABC transporter, permease protein PhnE [Belnapia rosea]|uniref:Phosphonate transport system permease protein n=1 Tax=Belnapia rosea TaxID=938405 RepID=A0A1G6RVY9_9PROT|nr:phosphonate ABC transporter, permease protein PhnE [Belnapia rosea]SDB71899.1 phosphonate transport system permease protein [Belnapia rosea]SDD08105.1 phosphonate transport system permease protein [Belnapia rosea]